MQNEFGKLEWRCRRGWLELDLLLNQFLDRCYSLMDSPDRAAFARLVELDDPELWQRITAPDKPDNQTPEGRVLTVLRNIAHTRH